MCVCGIVLRLGSLCWLIGKLERWQGHLGRVSQHRRQVYSAVFGGHPSAVTYYHSAKEARFRSDTEKFISCRGFQWCLSCQGLGLFQSKQQGLEFFTYVFLSFHDDRPGTRCTQKVMKEILYLCEVRGWLSMFAFFGYMPHAAIILEVACRFSWTQRNCVVVDLDRQGPDCEDIKNEVPLREGVLGYRWLQDYRCPCCLSGAFFLVQYPFGSTNDMNRCIAMKRWLILGLGFWPFWDPQKVKCIKLSRQWSWSCI